MSHLAQIIRHPIKSIGYETLQSAPLTKGRALPFDRVWAIAHEAASFGTNPTEWAHKRNFVRGVAAPELMAIHATLDEATGLITLTHPRAGTITLDPVAQADALLNWVRPLWPDTRPAAAGVVHIPGQPLADWPNPFLAVLGMASLRELGGHLGQDLSVHRFRGNLWVDGWAPFQEFDLIGQRLRIGEAELEIVQRITRCAATTTNPETGVQDADTLAALNTRYGHQDFGTYAVVTKSGTVAVNDPVEIL